MSISIQCTSPTRASSLNGKQQQPRLPVEEATRIIRIARRKSSTGASQRDRNLRVFLGHTHLAETLKLEYLDGDESFHHDSIKPSSLSPPQHIEWADPFPPSSAASTEDGAMEFEDDGEEDFCSLALVRTPSRSAQPPRAPV